MEHLAALGGRLHMITPAALISSTVLNQDEGPGPDSPTTEQAAQQAFERGGRTTGVGSDDVYTLFNPLRSTNTYFVNAAGATVNVEAGIEEPG